MQVLVTGAAGKIGQSLVLHLVSEGYRVRGADLSEGPEVPGVEWCKCDITDKLALRAAMVDCEAVVHLGALRLPWLAPEEEVFRVNGYGSFCVFRAAAEAGIRRVVSASSINALGMYFGLRRVTVARIPVTEEEGRVTSDVYSFSKQTQEDIADYFHRREGISSVSLRLGGVAFDPKPEPMPVRAAVQALLAEPREQARERVRNIVDRFFARSRDLRERYVDDWVNNSIATGAAHLWTVLDSRDCDQAFGLALAAQVDGALVINVSDAHNTLGIDARELASLFYPEAEVDPALSGTASLWSIERATNLLGFTPRYSVERFYSSV